MPDAHSPAAAEAGEARRRLPPEARTSSILSAALEEFAERGYAGARMAAVATRAGITKGLIYHYYPSKIALFRAAVRAFTEGTFVEAEARLGAPAGPARDLLRDILAVGYGRIAAEGREAALFRLIVSEAERAPELAAFYRTEVLERATRIARAVLRAGAASGEFRPEVAEMPMLAEAVVAPAIAAAVWHVILGADAPDLDGMRAAHLDLLLHGLGPSSPGPDPGPGAARTAGRD